MTDGSFWKTCFTNVVSSLFLDRNISTWIPFQAKWVFENMNRGVNKVLQAALNVKQFICCAVALPWASNPSLGLKFQYQNYTQKKKVFIPQICVPQLRELENYSFAI